MVTFVVCKLYLNVFTTLKKDLIEKSVKKKPYFLL